MRVPPLRALARAPVGMTAGGRWGTRCGTRQVLGTLRREDGGMSSSVNSSVSGPRVEFASERKIRERNKTYYRVLHWPIWITVFYLAPGPLTFALFAHGVNGAMAIWLACVLVGTGIAGLFGQLPGVEPRPYIIRFTEDRPNPLYRRICYTLAWSELVTYAVLNIAGLVWALISGQWILQQIYHAAYFPIAGTIWLLGLLGLLPRVRPSTKGEGDERRYFYGTVWSVPLAQTMLWMMYLIGPKRGFGADLSKLVVFLGIIVYMGRLAVKGVLPRTRKIVPGELAVSD